MTNAITNALRLLSHFWLEEIRPGDLPTITALPELAETLPDPSPATLTDLAVEYQRLFGFNLPPYESLFIDPSAMLLAPATARVQALYRQAGWTPPANIRVGAPDHLGLELLALAEIQAKAEAKKALAGLAQQLHTAHLVLWVPAFIATLRRLKPHPFYAILADLTLDLLLSILPVNSQFPIQSQRSLVGNFQLSDPFPTLPPPPVYKDQWGSGQVDSKRSADFNPHSSIDESSSGLRDIVKRLLTSRESGLFLTREDIAHISRALNLPVVMGERSHMLETLFHLAGEYELVPALLAQLRHLLAQVDTVYQGWADEYPDWTLYAEAWQRRVAATHVTLSADAVISD